MSRAAKNAVVGRNAASAAARTVARRGKAAGTPGKGRALVVIPTYNESENIREIVTAVLAVAASIDILVVDDNSPDGTARLVKAMQKKQPKRLHLMEREKKMGLGTAYAAGFGWALEHGYASVFEMDADFSHHPDYLRPLLAGLATADVVVGSRYVHGVSVIHWPLKRLLLSWFANFYARVITGVPVTDLTAGFVGYRRQVLEKIDYHTLKSSGYAFQVEMKYRAHRWGFRIQEIPIIFADRERGVSKISRRIIFEALLRCWTLRLGRDQKGVRAHRKALKRRLGTPRRD